MARTRTHQIPLSVSLFLTYHILSVTQNAMGSHSAAAQSRAYLVCLSLFTFGSGLIPHRGGRTPPDVPRLMVFVMTGKPWVHEDYVSSGIMINVAHLLSHTKQMLRMMDQSRE